MDDILENIALLIKESFWIAPFVAFLAGVLTSFMPCSLSTIPLVVGYVGGVGTEPKKAFKLSLVFAIGSALTFTVLGIVASLLGELIGVSAKWWYIVLGALMVLMSMQIWGIYNIIPSTYLLSKNKKRGYIGAFIAGILGGIFSSPCATPVLIALLAVVAGKGSIVWGGFLLLMYAIGHGILAIIAGTSIGFVRNLGKSKRYGNLSKILNIIIGCLVLLIGFYMFYLGF